jgi:mannose-6-phosphate isomerase-like protein (cupin superfamily)
MTRVVSTDSAEHYTWGERCDGWHLLQRDDLSVIQERAPPGSAEVRHRHARSRQFFFVLEGEATLEVDGVARAIRAGEGIEVPPGTAHQFRNESARDVVFLVISAPKSHGDRIPCAGDA